MNDQKPVNPLDLIATAIVELDAVQTTGIVNAAHVLNIHKALAQLKRDVFDMQELNTRLIKKNEYLNGQLNDQHGKDSEEEPEEELNG